MTGFSLLNQSNTLKGVIPINSMIITIAGMPGSGKSTVARILAEKLNLKQYSLGGLQRQVAQDKGITVHELSKLEGEDDTIDRQLDAYQEKLGQDEDNFIIDGRLSWHFIPHSIKIYLTVESHKGARRIFEARKSEKVREIEPEYSSVEETEKLMLERNTNDVNRYKEYYGVDTVDFTNYDLVINTTEIPAKQVAEKILEFVSKTDNPA